MSRGTYRIDVYKAPFYNNLWNIEILEQECNTDPKLYDSIDLEDDYWGLEEDDDED